MWPFAKKPVVDADTAAWHVENFQWLARQFGGAAFTQTKLVLPKPGFFISDGEQGHALALRIFTQVKRYCSMDDWDVELVADDNALARDLPPSLAFNGRSRYALGTFGTSGTAVQITYVPALLRHPERLIATFAHELAHYLLATAREPPPCADDEHEFLTDLTAVFLGFGVFLANARFQHETYSDGAMHGWRIGHSGYLPEADLIFALALFLQVRGLPTGDACACLKPHLAGLLRRAMSQVTAEDIGGIRDALAAVDAGMPHDAALDPSS